MPNTEQNVRDLAERAARRRAREIKPFPAHRRCNAPAMWYSASNGYKTCREHAEDGMILLWETGPGPYGPCDKPFYIEVS